MAQELIQLNTRKIVVRLFLLVLVIAAGTWSYFVVRWYTGNTLAEYFNSSGNDLRVAEMARSLAPDDPLTHWRMAQVTQRNLPLDQQEQAIAEYEKAVSLSPNDYRFWMSLGTASEQAGETAKAEHALRRAVELAPSYSYPHWFLGNLLLRNGRYDEAFAELRLASQADPELQAQQFNLIWEVYNSDAHALQKAVGESAKARAEFGLYLLTRQKYEDGLRMWDSISSEEKRSNRQTGEAIVNNLISAFHYHDAVRVWNDITLNENYRAEIGRVSDGGFEDPSSYGPEMVFGWQVRGVQGLQIGIDDRSHGEANSLRLAFHIRTNIEDVNIAQLVPVAPNTEYDFEFYVASEKLETGSPPLVQLIDPTTSGVLASSPAAVIGTSDWTRVGLSFKTGDKTEAVRIKVVRPSCGTKEVPICPIFGSVRYDDLSLKRRG
jgi:hypothetical protein